MAADATGALGWQDVAALARARLAARIWPPGAIIPPEAELAREFGVSRSTVNRALRALAEEGWLDRRRKAGTRVAERPVHRATLAIPLMRDEVEAAGHRYGYRLLDREVTATPGLLALQLGMRGVPRVLRLEALHLADGRPWAHEERWISPETAPGVFEADFAAQSANEWLVTHVPCSSVEVSVSAERATGRVAAMLECEDGEAILVVERITRQEGRGVTLLRLSHAPGHRIRSTPG
ncbi:transcriptional regulator, GntR family [Rubellimicrobium thermophilum DSM 16684]|uniref:Transcriptional regulator, GntR family n=1 Tax=Rubellimicrobium thermophilum DSM 16684 TaxID=1123069 RepID=S9S897_9RHOB|nr:GntR family transcriptional regulator [Rubellimicrobium thermophilum]EPX86400.1 transcriptional regulator, GntR family [Rubellimicrobium thermophilum DSM 16684]